ncbi:hypothetical protein LOD99_1110 [Oopsacas minuta]|uniref:SH2 domain-containing protein n=1 Tax=Oopsacas minuta TaxID=111878 RepID=A0AAV7K687_9METZ|nr:hypothetical protein LOD99_1089 [Oopsacas minuta]KAI6656310.1 hypothetical protein LOD99_1110 [Oopsacas minuta]
MQVYPSGIGGLSLLEGHLEMKLKRWKCYFVQLLGRQLFLFHDFNANPTQIHIHESATCKMGKSKRNNYQFSLHMGKTTHHFRAPNELHRATWMMHILEASKSVSPKRQASQRSVYSISSVSSIGSLGRYADDFFIGAPSEYVQFCRRTIGTRSTDSSPTPAEMDLGTRSLFRRRSLADCHLPLNNMRWYESAPPTPVPLMTPVPCLSQEDIDADIISLPDISTALHRQQKPKQHLERTGGMDNLETLDALSHSDKFQDLSSLDYTGHSNTSSQLDNYANFLQCPFYNPTSLDVLNTSLLELVRPPKFHRSTSLPHSLAKLSRDTNQPLHWINTRIQPALSVLSERHSPDTSTPHLTPMNFHSSLDRKNSFLNTTLPRLTIWPGNMELYVPPDTNTEPKTATNGCHSVTPDYENVDTMPPLLPKRTHTVPGKLVEVSKHMNITEPELFPLPISCLKRSILRSISRQDAEEILRGMAVGTFLVRFRESSPDKLALSIHMEDGIRHHRINSDTSGAYSIEGFDCCENSLEALLRAFILARNNQLTLFCPDEPLSDEDTHEWESNNSLDFIL